jgi:hypothetical protein
VKKKQQASVIDGLPAGNLHPLTLHFRREVIAKIHADFSWAAKDALA